MVYLFFSEKVLILENRKKTFEKKGTLSFNLEVMKDDTKINVKWYLTIELGYVCKYLSVKKSHFLTFFHIPCYFNQMKIWIKYLIVLIMNILRYFSFFVFQPFLLRVMLPVSHNTVLFSVSGEWNFHCYLYSEDCKSI